MTMRGTHGSPAPGRSLTAAFSGYHLAKCRPAHDPKAPSRKARRRSRGVKVPSSGSGGSSNRRTLIAMGIAGLIVVAAALGYALLGTGGSSSSSDAIKQLEAAGCTVQTVAALPSGDHSVLTPERHVEEVEHRPADERPALPAVGDLGCVHDAAQPGAGRAQPRARRHLHPVRQGRAAVDGRPAEVVLRPASERHAACAAAEARLEDRAGRVDDAQPDAPNTGTAYLAKCTSFDEKRLRRVLQGVPVPGPRAVPGRTRSRPARSSFDLGPAAPTTRRNLPGWRNWSYAPDLKSGVPRDVWVRVPAPACLQRASDSPVDR